jgi:hypothetical protein
MCVPHAGACAIFGVRRCVWRAFCVQASACIVCASARARLLLCVHACARAIFGARWRGVGARRAHFSWMTQLTMALSMRVGLRVPARAYS